VKLIKYLILDVFAYFVPSVFTVMQYNAEDDRISIFIMSQLDDVTNPDSKAQKCVIIRTKRQKCRLNILTA